MSTAVVRRSSRLRYCDSCMRLRIGRGERYLVHTVFPGVGDVAGYATTAGHPVRFAECAECASTHGRGTLVADFESHGTVR